MLLLILSILSTSAYSQNTNPTDSTNSIPGNPASVNTPTSDSTIAAPPKPKKEKKVYAKFDTIPFQLKAGNIISKTLRIDNNTDKDLTFSVDVAFPPSWRSFNSRDKQYTVASGDSIFIPVRIIPVGKIIGNTKYLINAYVLEKDSTPVATSHFYVIREKLSQWELTIEPLDRIYFKNNDNTSYFDVGIINTGNEKQELILDIENNRTQILLFDTNDRVLNKTTATMNLKPGEDTVFKYKVKYVSGIRNQRLIDLDSYRPNSENETKSYMLFAKTSEPKARHASAHQKSKRVDFIRLSDRHIENQFGYNSLPVILNANVSNLIGGQPILNINLRGTSFLENGGTLAYNSQTFFSNNYYTNQYVLGSNNYVGYFDDKYQIQLGNVGGIGPGSYGTAGRGMTARYAVTKEHKVGAFYTRLPRFFKPTRESYGAAYNFTPTFGNYAVGYSRVIEAPLQLTTNYYNIYATTRLPAKQSIGFNTVIGNHNSQLPGSSFTRTGLVSNLSYSGLFFDDNRLRSTASLTYISKFFAPYNEGEAWIANMNHSYQINKRWEVRANSFYNKREMKRTFFNTPEITTTNIRNAVNFSRRRADFFLTPGLFYNINQINADQYHSRGASFNFGTYDYATNRLISNSIITGYNRTVGEQPLRDYYFLQYFMLFRYKTIAANFRYTYGNISAITNTQVNLSKYPQSLGASLNYQYQFKNSQFLLQNYLSYSYYNWFERHNFALFPVLYFYSKSGWRVHAGAGYFYSRSNASGERVAVDNSFNGFPLAESEPTRSHSINAQFGVRKEFGIPIPYSKQKYFDVDFVAFIDLNGNRKKDGNEYTLENVVIGLNKMEILTNENGQASLINIEENDYTFYAFSLIDLDGYFPYIDDTISISKDYTGDSVRYVPFVKGIKIFGEVVVEREAVAKNTEVPLDLSGIKISAINGKTVHTLTERDGSFSFYVPYGKYTLNMDETILGSRFSILENNIELELDRKTENLYITFYVIENKRKIIRKRFDSDGNLIEGDGSEGGSTGSTGAGSPQGPIIDKVAQANAEAAKVRPIPTWDVAKDKFLENVDDITKTKGLIYTVQVGAFQKPLNPNVFDGMKQLMYERIDKNFVRICAGRFNSEGSATLERDNLRKVGFPGAYVTAYYEGKFISLEEAKKKEQE